ncbi:hypothetical protein F5Y01DRAFT_267611 [Xylaria sp. FL0043]|nr:hypothetical protein F5Y01DRAFT_267611 [Xylaria sp. FL0043]
MVRNTFVYNGTIGDDEEYKNLNLPPLDPLGFLDLVPRRTPTENPPPRSRQHLASVQPPRDIDRIRNEVNQWMQGDEFGVAGVPDQDIEPVDATENAVDPEVPVPAYEDTYDVVENLLASNIDEPEPVTPVEPMLPDPAAESIFRTAATQDNASSTELDNEREVFTDGTSETARVSTLIDETEEISHVPEELKLSNFQNALGLWVNLHNVSRSAYSHLIEVFQLATDIDDIKSVAKRKETLKAQIYKSLPLGKLRRSTVNLDMSRLPTRSKSTEQVLTIDLEDTLKTFLSSSRVFNQIYKGMAQYTKSQVRNPWEAPWWGESIRTSSGKFHCYYNGEPIFPSDFVTWKCQAGLTDHGHDICATNCERTHVGRVVWSGLDVSDMSPDEDQSGKPLLLIQRVYQRGGFIPFHLITLTAMMSQSRCAPGANELVIVEDSIFPLHPKQIVRQLTDVHLDYQFCTKAFRSQPQLLTAPYTVRYIWNESKMQTREIKYSSPHRAELELRTFGRDYAINNFARREMISLPLQMFVDAFGLYRNMYRSIEGLYFFPQFFDVHVRNRRSSVITATLGPYGAQRADIFKTLFRTTDLDRGTELVINGKSIFVCSFVSAIIGDMPSQQELSGCLGPTANYPCRYCLVSSGEKGDMDFDISRLGKYHDQILHDRARLFHQVSAPTTRRGKLAGLGLHDNETLFSTLRTLFPALDIIRSRPIDAAHSEYSGISKYLHRLIFQEATSLLTRAAGQQASEVFHYFPVPPGWPRFQSPRTHLDSYLMQEYARGIIILPVFLRCWLRDHHIKPELHKYFYTRARDYLDPQNIPNNTNRNFSVADLVMIAVWTVTQSVIATCSQNNPLAKPGNHNLGQHDILRNYIIAGRRAFQFLCQVQSDALQVKASGQAAARASRANRAAQVQDPSRGQVLGRAPSIVSLLQSEAAFSQEFLAPTQSLRTTPTGKRRQADSEEKINQFLRWKQLPNVHSGLHLAEVAREYGNPTMVFTLLGEDMHKHYKALIYGTNHIDAAATLVNINNLRKTIAFLLAGCFEKELPQLHATYQILREQCPRLSQALDPYLGEHNGVDDLDISYTEIAGDPSHKQSRAFLKVPRRIVIAREDPMLRVATPQDLKNNCEFFAMMRKASEEHYGNYMADPGQNPLRWWRKVVFTTAHGDRRTFGIHDFAKISSSDQLGFSVARIDGIFTHQRTYSNHLYLCVRFAVPRRGDGGHDPILKLPYYDVTDERSIVGLPQVGEKPLWMVDLFEKGMVCVEHDVYFM